MTNISPDPAEDPNVDFLASLSDDRDPKEVARRVLRKHNGDAERAANAMLSGDKGEEDDIPPLMANDPPSGTQSTSLAQITPLPNDSVIDLTVPQEDDLSRAIQLSMNDTSNVKFGPSERAPNDAWSMVPSNSV